MKSVIFLSLLLVSICSNATNITFRVDLEGIEVHPKGIYISGEINWWKFDQNPLSKTTNNIYEITLDLDEGQTYEYKFFNGPIWEGGEFAFGPCANGGFRSVTVDQDKVLPIVPFGLCNGDFPEDKIKVACVGNSITYGHGLGSERAKICYPAQLQKILGEEYITYNFGNPGKTMSKDINDSYWKTSEFNYSHKPFLPNVVVIMLGTNDSKPFIWDKRKEHLKRDLIEFYNSFDTLSTSPTIYLATPAFAYNHNFDVSNTNIEKGIIPIIKEVSEEMGINLIDIHEATQNKQKLFPDGVHPDKEGALIIAQKIGSVLKEESPKMIIKKKKLSTNKNGVKYRWYKNGQLIGETSQASLKLTAIDKNAHYKVAVKLLKETDDWVVSKN
ncbi:GDSL-type esterase/lipase family protein [Flammeovirga agarivorans]|uniref:SGNH hydrolase-type esterase domain-containing protein n=1 Tax=Flammeovirga agarivorans TaxID=2726742 RepID=A0A7X8SQ08_9BACT|nr:GDSL-type esterase/lipase family protein [Flammeovirga agarivorans]NLR94289.1 hypothetical protein [Flammeovirga agarivorans]